MSETQGCSDGNCWLRIDPLVGQHTNAGCHCLHYLPVPLRIQIERKLQSQRTEIARTRRDLAKLMEAAMTVYERTVTPEPCTCRQCNALADLWAVMQQVKLFGTQEKNSVAGEVSDE
jgi:hypothetical protein